MKSTLMLATGMLAIGLAACNPAPKSGAPATDDTMSEMMAPAAITHAKGVGTVTAIDAATGKITFDHGPIVELEWPAMTMGFDAPPAILTAAKVGEKVAFEFEWNGKSGTLTEMTPAG